jgi:HEAT repeat protein
VLSVAADVKSHIALLAVFASLCFAGCASNTGDDASSGAHEPPAKSPPKTVAKKQPAVPEKPPLDERLYGGEPLANWVANLKNIDPRGPEGVAAVDGLIALVRDGDVPMPTRIQAAVALGRIGRPAEKAVPVFVEFLMRRKEPKDPKQHAELMFSLKALTMLGPAAKSATPELVRLARDSDWSVYVRGAALEALARIGPADAKAVETIVSMLTYRGDVGVSIPDRLFLRRFAADAVGIIGPDAYVAIPRLRLCMRHHDAELRRRSALALGAMKARGRDGIVSLVDALVRDDSPVVRDAAGDALAMLGTLALPELRKLMKLDDAEAKARAALSLGKIGPPAKEALPDLDDALDDDDAWVRINAAEAIWLISGNADKAAAAMVEELRSSNRQIRIKAYRFFKTLGPKAKSVAPALERLLEHKRGEVRTAASKALQAVRAKR